MTAIAEYVPIPGRVWTKPRTASSPAPASSKPTPRRAGSPPSGPVGLHGTITAISPMGPAQHRLLIDYRRPLRGYQEQHDTDVDPVVPKMFGIVVSRERASFVVEHAAVGHAVAISTDPDFGSRVKIGTGVIIDPRVQTYETLERFRQEPPK